MEDQGKRLLIAVGLVAVLYLAWSLIFAPKPPQQQTQAPPPAESSASVASSGGPTSGPSSQPTSMAAGGVQDQAPQAAKCVPDASEIAPWETPEWTATFSRCGGTIMSWRLKNERFRDKETNQQIDLVLNSHADPHLYPLQVQVATPASGGADLNEARIPAIPDGATWDLVVQPDPNQIQFRWSSPDVNKGIEVTKTFRRTAGKYVIGMDVEVKNVSQAKRVAELAVDVWGYQDPNARSRSMFHYAEPHWQASCAVDGDIKSDWMTTLKNDGPRTHNGDVHWIGFTQKYFMFAAGPTDKDSFSCTSSAPQSPPGAFLTRLDYVVPTSLDAGQSFKRSVIVYAGPKLLDQLEAVNTLAGKDVKMTASVELGWFAFIARPMMSLLRVLHSGVGNWGLAIIILTLLVKLLTLYWTQKSMRSMKAMSRLKPKMDELRKKYENDKTRLNQEMMGLYKQHGINPLGGCLPMLLQMPIWIALYQTLGNAAELYRAPFVGWIHDLTAPDPYFIIPGALVVLMFIQTRISPASVDQAQQRMMQFMMPIMFGGMSLFFPAGLTIYILTNTILSIAHQTYMNRTDKGLQPVPTPEPPVEPKSSSSSSSSNQGRSGKNGRKKMAKA